MQTVTTRKFILFKELENECLDVGRRYGLHSLEDVEQFINTGRQSRTVLEFFMELNERFPEITRRKIRFVLRQYFQIKKQKYQELTPELSQQIRRWVEINGREWGKAEEEFQLKRKTIRALYLRSLSPYYEYERKPIDLTEYVHYLRYIAMWCPYQLYQVQNRALPLRYCDYNHAEKKVGHHPADTWKYISKTMKYRNTKSFTPDEYYQLIVFIMNNSSPIILDRLPSFISFRYLSYPVDGYNHEVFIQRLLFFYYWFIDRIDRAWTVREYLEFLLHEEGEKEGQAPCMSSTLKVHASHVEVTAVSDIRSVSKELGARAQREMIELNQITIPSDVDLMQLIDAANSRGNELIWVAMHGDIIEGDIEKEQDKPDDVVHLRYGDRELTMKNKGEEEEEEEEDIELDDNDDDDEYLKVVESIAKEIDLETDEGA